MLLEAEDSGTVLVVRVCARPMREARVPRGRKCRVVVPVVGGKVHGYGREGF